MKTLLLMRHAKSSWNDDSLPDHDRPLNDRGRRTAPLMARWLETNDSLPDLVVSSTALRAKSTAAAIIETANLPCDIITDTRLYHSSPNEMTEVAREVDDSVETLMLVAHNPGMQQFASMFADRFLVFPTAAIAVIDLEIENWIEFQVDSQGKLLELWIPKDLSFEK